MEWYTISMLTRYVQRNLTWIDCVSPTPAEVRSLMHEFGIDPLIAEELALPSFKSKVERRGEIIYVILHFPTLRGAHQHPEQEVDFILGKHFLITTRYESVDPIHSFAKAFEVEAVLGRDSSRTHGGHLFVAMVENLYKALGDECDAVRRRLQTIEEYIFRGDERKMVAQLSQVGRVIHDFRQAITPHQEMLASLEPPATRMFGAEFSYHLHNLAGAYGRVSRMLENLRDSLGELRETNNSLLSTKQNEIMKTLTVLAFVFMPLTFMTGLFGMSTEYIPLMHDSNGFQIVLGGMLLVACGCFVYFRRKGWL